MQLHEINICQVIIFRHYTVYKKYDDDKSLAIKPKNNCKYYLKCSNNFAADCKLDGNVDMIVNTFLKYSSYF